MYLQLNQPYCLYGLSGHKYKVREFNKLGEIKKAIRWDYVRV